MAIVELQIPDSETELADVGEDLERLLAEASDRDLSPACRALLVALDEALTALAVENANV